MPLSVNVGLSRKAAKDYQSTGVSINLTAELDQSLLGRPAELQQQVEALYAQAQQALDRQVQALGEPRPLTRRPPQAQNRPAAAPRSRPQGGESPGMAASSGRPSNGHARNGSAMTASQRRAIASIARAVGVDPAGEAKDLLGVDLEELSIRQASELIDHLKSLCPSTR